MSAVNRLSPEAVRDISVAVYKARLGAADTARMLAADGDGGVKLRQRAASYDPLTRAYVEILGAASVRAK